MRNTMRDGSVKRKPARATSRHKHNFGLGHARQDSLSPTRPALTSTPSPSDATLAAQAAQMRLATPSPVAFVPHGRCQPTSDDSPSISPVDSIRNTMQRCGRGLIGRQSIERDAEDIQMRSIASGQNSIRSASDAPMLHHDHTGKNTQQYQRREGFAGKLKSSFSGAMGGYKAVWRERKEHVSDEHLALRAIVDFVAQRRGNRIDKKSITLPVPIEKFSAGLPYEHQGGGSSSSRFVPDTVAWPVGNPKPMHRAPTPPPAHVNYRPTPQLSLLQPHYGSRTREDSILTSNTGVTLWGDVQDAVNRESSIRQPNTNKRDFATPPNKVKGKVNGKPDLAVQTKNLPFSESRPKPVLVKQDSSIKYNSVLDFQALNNVSIDPEPDFTKWNPNDHKFDLDRQSWISEAENGYRTHTDASSIYSRPARDEPGISQFPPPPVPTVPGEYISNSYTKATITSRPVSPLTVDAPIASFLSPSASRRNTGIRVAGDWTDSYYLNEDDEGKGRVSPVAVTKPAPAVPHYGSDTNEQYDNRPRGTQFYDFYRDSGAVFGWHSRG